MTAGGTVRLDRLLANLGYGSRREIALLARTGRLALDGAPVGDVGNRVPLGPALAERLRIDGEAPDPQPGMVLMLHKPVGVTCSAKDAGPLVTGLLPPRWRRRDPALSTVGRLDKDTSGLLLLTDDGALLHRIISPRANVAKRYRARLARPLAGNEAEIFASGTLMLDGETKPLLPAGLDVAGEHEARVTVHEGRYHQVRRMFAALGNHVETLHREAMGELELPVDLEPGAFRLLAPTDLARVFAAPAPAT